jgi:hypothetical protein
VRAKLTYEQYGHRVINVGFHAYSIESIENSLKLLRTIDVPPPFWVMVSMIGVKDALLPAGYATTCTTPISRDVLMLPEAMIETYDDDVKPTSRTIFDVAWNAAGYERCFYYNDKGPWSPKR